MYPPNITYCSNVLAGGRERTFFPVYYAGSVQYLNTGQTRLLTHWIRKAVFLALFSKKKKGGGGRIEYNLLMLKDRAS